MVDRRWDFEVGYRGSDIFHNSKWVPGFDLGTHSRVLDSLVPVQ